MQLIAWLAHLWHERVVALLKQFHRLAVLVLPQFKVLDDILEAGSMPGVKMK